MVVHLKRFRQSTKSTNKLETLVEFPLENFDMGPNMARQPAVTAAPTGAAAVASTSDAVTAVTTAGSDGTTTTISTANDGPPSVTTNGATTAKV